MPIVDPDDLPWRQAEDVRDLTTIQGHVGATDEVGCGAINAHRGVGPVEAHRRVLDPALAVVADLRPEVGHIPSHRRTRRASRIGTRYHPDIGTHPPRITITDLEFNGHHANLLRLQIPNAGDGDDANAETSALGWVAWRRSNKGWLRAQRSRPKGKATEVDYV